jgi:hypothetical protein
MMTCLFKLYALGDVWAQLAWHAAMNRRPPRPRLIHANTEPSTQKWFRKYISPIRKKRYISPDTAFANTEKMSIVFLEKANAVLKWWLLIYSFGFADSHSIGN